MSVRKVAIITGAGVRAANALQRASCGYNVPVGGFCTVGAARAPMPARA
jgi:hypothetical protein